MGGDRLTRRIGLFVEFSFFRNVDQVRPNTVEKELQEHGGNSEIEGNAGEVAEDGHEVDFFKGIDFCAQDRCGRASFSEHATGTSEVYLSVNW